MDTAQAIGRISVLECTKSVEAAKIT